MKNLICLLALFGLSNAALAADPVTSYLPQQGLGELLASRFDLASIRSSNGPRRKPGQNTFAALGILPTRTTESVVQFDSPEWYFSMTVLRRADLNKDGIEDLEVCYVDKAKAGSYSSQQALLVTRYGPEENLVALAYAMSGCDSFAR